MGQYLRAPEPPSGPAHKHVFRAFRLIADTAYGANDVRAFLLQQGTER